MLKKLIIVFLLATAIISLSACGLTSSSVTSDSTGDLSAQAGETIALPSDNSLVDTAASTDASQAEVVDTQPAVGKTVKMTLYFPTQDNSALKGEERDVQVYDGAIIKATVQALLQGPDTNGLHSAIPTGTGLNGVNLKNNVAIVDFTSDFASADSAAGNVERMSVVNTLTKISGVDKVTIRVNGQELLDSSGAPLGAMSPAALDNNGVPLTAGN